MAYFGNETEIAEGSLLLRRMNITVLVLLVRRRPVSSVSIFVQGPCAVAESGKC